MALEESDVIKLRRMFLHELAGIFQGSQRDATVIAEIRTRLREAEADELSLTNEVVAEIHRSNKGDSE